MCLWLFTCQRPYMYKKLEIRCWLKYCSRSGTLTFFQKKDKISSKFLSNLKILNHLKRRGSVVRLCVNLVLSLFCSMRVYLGLPFLFILLGNQFQSSFCIFFVFCQFYVLNSIPPFVYNHYLFNCHMLSIFYHFTVCKNKNLFIEN